MPKHRWTIPCESAIVDAQSNNVSLINIIERVTVPPKAEGIPARFILATLWEREGDGEEEFTYRILWRPPKGRDFCPTPDAIAGKIEADKRYLRVFLEVRGLPLRGAGDYVFAVQTPRGEDRWQTKATVRIRVVYEPG